MVRMGAPALRRESRWEQELVAGRTCGACYVCCVALTIDDPALQKVQGYRCRNALPSDGCAFYEARPDTCRTFLYQRPSALTQT